MFIIQQKLGVKKSSECSGGVTNSQGHTCIKQAPTTAAIITPNNTESVRFNVQCTCQHIYQQLHIL